MKAQQFQVDTIANNIANANTNGFKKSRLSFQSLYYQTYRSQGSAQGNGVVDATGLQVGNGTKVSGSAMMMEQGQQEVTGNPLDVAIQGSGYFQIETVSGEKLYTRDGAFRRNKDGDLVTADGGFLSPRVSIEEGVTQVAIAANGEMSYVDDAGQVQTGDQIQIFRFPNRGGLRAEGANLLAETPSSGQPISSVPGQNGTGSLQQNTLERSNVTTVEELVSLIVAQRNYEVNSRAIQVSDEMLQTVGQIIR